MTSTITRVLDPSTLAPHVSQHVPQKTGGGPYKGTALAAENNIYRHSVCRVYNIGEQVSIEAPYEGGSRSKSSGSGVVIQCRDSTPRGYGFYILTNHHVVSNAKILTVTWPASGSQHPFHVVVVADCPQRDLALLQLRTDGLPDGYNNAPEFTFIPVKIAQSDGFEMGSATTAVGYPLGREEMTRTSGTLNARTMLSQRTFLATDSALAPGCSGGPLLSHGDGVGPVVIGLNDCIIKGQSSMGFAIPGEAILNFIHDAHLETIEQPQLETRLVETLHWGFGTKKVTEDWVANHQHGSTHKCQGLTITKVVPKTLCDGVLELHDQLLSFSVARLCDERIQLDKSGQVLAPFWQPDPISFKSAWSRIRDDDKVTLHIVRNGIDKDVVVVAKIAKDKGAVPAIYTDYEAFEFAICAGMVLANLTQNHVSHFAPQNHHLLRYEDPQIRATEPSLIVTKVLGGSIMRKSGLDVIPGTILHSITAVSYAGGERDEESFVVRCVKDLDAIKKADFYEFVFQGGRRTFSKQHMQDSMAKLIQNEGATWHGAHVVEFYTPVTLVDSTQSTGDDACGSKIHSTPVVFETVACVDVERVCNKPGDQCPVHKAARLAEEARLAKEVALDGNSPETENDAFPIDYWVTTDEFPLLACGFGMSDLDLAALRAVFPPNALL